MVGAASAGTGSIYIYIYIYSDELLMRQCIFSPFRHTHLYVYRELARVHSLPAHVYSVCSASRECPECVSSFQCCASNWSVEMLARH